MGSTKISLLINKQKKKKIFFYLTDPKSSFENTFDDYELVHFPWNTMYRKVSTHLLIKTFIFSLGKNLVPESAHQMEETKSWSRRQQPYCTAFSRRVRILLKPVFQHAVRPIRPGPIRLTLRCRSCQPPEHTSRPRLLRFRVESCCLLPLLWSNHVSWCLPCAI